MKKVVYITLLVTLLTQSGGLFFILKLQQCSIWYEMMEEVLETQTGFSKLVLTVEEFESGKINKHEILFKGKMYDFKSAVITGNKVELLALIDDREQEVINKINRYAANTNESKSPLSLKFVKLFSTSYILPDTELSIIFRNKIEYIFVPYQEVHQCGIFKISSPPPELI